MKRVFAGLVLGLALGFVLGHFTASPVEGAGKPCTGKGARACLTPTPVFTVTSTPTVVPSTPTPVTAAAHWAHTGPEARIGVRTLNLTPAQVQMLADVLAEWSRVEGLEVGIVGTGSLASCTWSNDFQVTSLGEITVCGDGNYGAGYEYGWIGTFPYHDPNGHMIAGSVHVVSYYDEVIPGKMQHSMCHELGNALGLLDYTFKGETDADNFGCMTGGMNADLRWRCPAQQDLDVLGRAYAHTDGFDSAKPATFTVTGEEVLPMTAYGLGRQTLEAWLAVLACALLLAGAAWLYRAAPVGCPPIPIILATPTLLTPSAKGGAATP